MFKFKVKGTSYALPQTIYEITHAQGLEIKELEKVFGGVNYGYKLNVLEMLSGCDRLKDVVEAEINAIYAGLPLFSNNTQIHLSDVVVMNNKKYGLVDLGTITTQEYMDIEQLFNNTKDYHSIASALSSILYRPVASVKKSFKTRLINARIKISKSKFIKPYACIDYTISEYNLKASDVRIQEIEKCFSWGDCLSCLAYYLSWKKQLAEKFFLLFPKSDDDKKETQEKEVIGMSSIWGMYHQLSLMTERDLEKINYYKHKPLNEVFYHLSYCVQENNYKNNK